MLSFSPYGFTDSVEFVGVDWGNYSGARAE